MEYVAYLVAFAVAVLIAVVLYRTCWMIRKPDDNLYEFVTRKVDDDGVKHYTYFLCSRPR